jgi:hypothetical protein
MIVWKVERANKVFPKLHGCHACRQRYALSSCVCLSLLWRAGWPQARCAGPHQWGIQGEQQHCQSFLCRQWEMFLEFARHGRALMYMKQYPQLLQWCKRMSHS